LQRRWAVLWRAAQQASGNLRSGTRPETGFVITDGESARRGSDLGFKLERAKERAKGIEPS